MDDYTQYDSFSEDRIMLDNDIKNGNGVSARLLVAIMNKHGWEVKHLAEWHSRGKVKAQNIASYEFVVRRDNKHVESN